MKAKLNFKTIKWYQWFFLRFLPTRKAIHTDPETGVVTEVDYKTYRGAVFIVGERHGGKVT